MLGMIDLRRRSAELHWTIAGAKFIQSTAGKAFAAILALLRGSLPAQISMAAVPVALLPPPLSVRARRAKAAQAVCSDSPGGYAVYQ